MGRAVVQCPGCRAGLSGQADTCAFCGRSLTVDLDLAIVDHDDELGPAPGAEPVYSGTTARNVVVGIVAAGALIAAALLVGRDTGTSSTGPVSTVPVTSMPAASAPTTAPVSGTPGMRFRQVLGRGPMLPELTGTVLYGLTQDGALVRIELDEGDVTWRDLQLSDAASDHQLLAREGAVVVAPTNRQRPRVVADTLTGVVREAVFGGPVLFGPQPDELWLLRGRGDGDVYRTAQLVKLDGTPVGSEVTLPPLFVLGSDGAGAPLLWGVSGTYRVDPATNQWQRVSEQRLAGWGAAAFVDLGCDDGLPCHWRVHDRSTGLTRLLPEPVPDDAMRAFFDRGRVSPDGRWLARVGRNGASLQVVDLTTGATRALVAPADGTVSDLAWSPDGRWLFWLDADRITLWKAGTAEPLLVLSGVGWVPEVVALTATTASSA